MGKSTHFSGQPLYSQIIKLLDKSEFLRISSEQGAERYVKSFDAWTHLLVMLYAVIMRFDSLREITASLQAEACKLRHLGIFKMTSRSTLADGNKRRSEAVFEAVYRDLYAKHRHLLSSDSRLCTRKNEPKWMKRLKIIDSTTITLFSNLLFKGVGRHPKTGKKKGGIKVHSIIQANEGVPSDIRFTSAATNDSFMLLPAALNRGGYHCHGSCLHRLCEVSADDGARRRLCHEDEEEPAIHDRGGRHVSNAGRGDAGSCTTGYLPKGTQGRFRNCPSRTHRHLCRCSEA